MDSPIRTIETLRVRYDVMPHLEMPVATFVDNVNDVLICLERNSFEGRVIAF